MKIPISGTIIKIGCGEVATLVIIKNSAIKPLVKGKPMLANAEKIKIFDINGELSEREFSSLIDLVPLALKMRPTLKNKRQIINPWDIVWRMAELIPISLFIARARKMYPMWDKEAYAARYFKSSCIIAVKAP